MKSKQELIAPLKQKAPRLQPMPVSATTTSIIELIRRIPHGKVASYAQIAKMAGLTNGARQVSRILHSCSKKYALPWHRVIRSDGSIALAEEHSAALQRSLLHSI